MNQSRTIRLPVHVIKELNVVLRATRTSRPMAIASRRWRMWRILPAAPGKVRRVLALNERMDLARRAARGRPDALDRRVGAGRYDFPPDRRLENAEIESQVQDWLAQLNDKQRRVIECRYGLNGAEI